MNPYDPSMTVDWGDSTYTFRLGIDQMLELEQKCDCGIYVLFDRLTNRKWGVNDVRETIRLALIGGGKVTPAEALRLVRLYVDQRPLVESCLHAMTVLGLAILPPEPIAKKAGAARAKEAKATGSTPPVSTETALS